MFTLTLLMFLETASFFPSQITSRNQDLTLRKRVFSLSAGSGRKNDHYYHKLSEEKQHSEVMDALFADGSSLVPIYLVGQGTLSVSSNRTNSSKIKQRVFFLSATENAKQQIPSVILPMNSPSELKLVSFAAAKRRLSKSVLLSLNMLLVNRDGAVFDNLPWSTWSMDPQNRNRDAAGNAIEEKLHLGKRDAYYRLMGKDWQGRSLAIGNLALRLKYMLDPKNYDGDESIGLDDDLEMSRSLLAKRVLELKLRETRMELAGLESDISIATNNKQIEGIALLQSKMSDLEEMLQTLEADMKTLSEKTENTSSLLATVLEKIANWSTKDGENAAPYRGATGYSPMLDTKEDIDGSLLPYTSPFDVLKEILEDQLKARVIGCVLENSSLLKGNTVLGGAIVLQRITATKTRKIMGEELTFEDVDEDFGNIDVKGGALKIVECNTDEAIGISLAHNVPLKVSLALFQQMSLCAEPIPKKKVSSQNILDAIPKWQTSDADVTLQIEGESQLPGMSSPISIPGNFDDVPSDSSSLFPVDSPIKSIDEYDELSDEDKAKTLLEMSNFSGKLPRPRVVRQSESNPLDELLLPLIDETVRKQYLIRDAERKGDNELVKELKSTKSRRQKAIEKAESARKEGNSDLANRWDSESDFLESLRADSTQDEGSYNRFLDKDDWYERDRQATANRIKKSSFGTLLDGIE